MIEQKTEVTNQPAQQEIVPEVQSNKKSLKIILLVILGLAFVAGAVYAGMQISKKQTPVVLPTAPPPNVRPTDTFPSSIPDETVNWKTYNDETYKYAISYPSNFILLSFPDNIPGIIMANYDKSIILTITSPTGTLYANASEKLIPIKNLKFTIAGKEYVSEENEAFYFPSEKKYKFRIFPILKNGVEWSHSTDIFSIEVSYSNPNDLKLIGQILSTFKFIQ